MFTAINQLLEQHSQLILLIASASLIMLVLCIATLPFLVAAIPDDYFSEKKRPKNPANLPWPVVITVRLIKNIVGLVLVLAGIAMLVFPGQGVLTLLMGLILLDYPGKFQLERKVISYPAVLATINWMRRKRGKQEFRLQD